MFCVWFFPVWVFILNEMFCICTVFYLFSLWHFQGKSNTQLSLNECTMNVLNVLRAGRWGQALEIILLTIILLLFSLRFHRAVQLLLSMLWLIMCSVSQQPAPCTGPDMSPSLTTPPTQQLWRRCRRTQRWLLPHTEDTQATQCHKLSLPQPSSCPSTTSTRRIDDGVRPHETKTYPCMWLNHPSYLRLFHHAEASLELLTSKRLKDLSQTPVSLPGPPVSWTQEDHGTVFIMQQLFMFAAHWGQFLNNKHYWQ